jgi:hypothetical protein
LHSLDFSLSIPFFEDGCVLGAPVFNAFGVIPQFPAIADKLLAETARLAAKLHEAYNSLRGFAADCEVPGDLILTRRILLERLLGSPQEVSEKR